MWLVYLNIIQMMKSCMSLTQGRILFQVKGPNVGKAAIITINNVGKIIDIGGLSNLSVVRNLVKDIFRKSSL